jgi:hypothetical protein
LEAEDLLAVEHEDSIGDLEAGVDRGSSCERTFETSPR